MAPVQGFKRSHAVASRKDSELSIVSIIRMYCYYQYYTVSSIILTLTVFTSFSISIHHIFVLIVSITINYYVRLLLSPPDYSEVSQACCGCEAQRRPGCGVLPRCLLTKEPRFWGIRGLGFWGLGFRF